MWKSLVWANRYLYKSTISPVKFCSHVNSLGMELGILTNKNKSSALQLLQAFSQVLSPVKREKVLIPDSNSDMIIKVLDKNKHTH